MSKLHVIKLSAGELPRPWIITDDSDVIDKRAGRWTNGGRGWATKREASEAIAEIESERTANRGPGRPSTGTEIKARVPDDIIAKVDKAAADFAISRAEMVRWILASWAS